MPIIVKHSGNAAPFAAGAFAGSAKRGGTGPDIPAWGAGEYSSRRKRGRRRHEEMTEEERLLEGLTKVRAPTVATRAGFAGPTPVGSYNPNTLAARSGFAGPMNLDGTRNLTPEEIAKNAQALATKAGDKVGYLEKKKIDMAYDSEMRRRDAEVALEAERMNRSEYDYRQGMERKKFDYKRQFDYPAKTHVGQVDDPYDYDFTDQQRQRFDQLNQAADEVRNSGEFKAGSPEQMDALAQIEKLQDEIKPTRRLKEKAQDPLAIAQSKIFTDPNTGKRGFIKANGDLEFIKDEPDPAVMEAEKQKEDITKRYRELANSEMTEYVPRKDLKGKTVVDASGKPVMDMRKRPRTPEEIKKAIDDEQAFMESYLNPVASSPAGKVVAPNGDTSYEGDTGLAIQKTERLFKKLRGMDQRMLAPEAKAILGMGEAEYIAKAQAAVQNKASPVYGMSVNDAIAFSMSRIMPK